MLNKLGCYLHLTNTYMTSIKFILNYYSIRFILIAKVKKRTIVQCTKFKGDIMKRKFLALALAVLPFTSYAEDLEQNKTQTPVVIDAVHAKVNSRKTIAELLKFENLWVREPSSTSVNTAAYFKISNNSDTDVVLFDVVTDAGLCNRTEIHGYKTDSEEVKKMYKLESITIPAKSSMEFVPGSFHVMLMGLEKAIHTNDIIPITLKFKPADSNSQKNIPEIKLNFPVMPAK